MSHDFIRSLFYFFRSQIHISVDNCLGASLASAAFHQKPFSIVLAGRYAYLSFYELIFMETA